MATDREKVRMKAASANTVADRHTGASAFVQAVHGVRYQVKDVALYTTHLGFTCEQQPLPRSPTFRLATRTFFSAGHRHRNPDGNPIELFEPADNRAAAQRDARMTPRATNDKEESSK